ncbi:MAG TPA: hypothetical protein VGF55_02500 [Gemmataceae bacterium]
MPRGGLGTHKRSRLLVDGERSELQAAGKTDTSVAEALVGLQA